jgi:ankyrin
MTRAEASFLEQTQAWHAGGAGRDLDAAVHLFSAAIGATVERLELFHHEDSESSEDVLIEVDDDDVDIEINDGYTRLMFAASRGWCSSIKWLLENGADIHAGFHRWTPLHDAVDMNQRDAAVLLLDAGARVDARDADGHTALQGVAYSGNLEMCKLLLSRGASLELRNPRGKDVEAIARDAANTTTVDLLAAVRAAGGWAGYVDAPRKELLALRRQLPSLRERGRAAPSSSVSVHERLFVEVPDDVFVHAVAFWHGPRDL